MGRSPVRHRAVTLIQMVTGGLSLKLTVSSLTHTTASFPIKEMQVGTRGKNVLTQNMYEQITISNILFHK